MNFLEENSMQFDRDDAEDNLRVPALVWLNYPIMMIMMIITMMMEKVECVNK